MAEGDVLQIVVFSIIFALLLLIMIDIIYHALIRPKLNEW
jgi:Na+/H+-dicarboxylate symporter